MKNDRITEPGPPGEVPACTDSEVGARLVEYVEQLSLFALGKLDYLRDLEMHVVQEHLVTCPHCQEVFQDLVSGADEREREGFFDLLKENEQIIFRMSQET